MRHDCPGILVPLLLLFVTAATATPPPDDGRKPRLLLLLGTADAQSLELQYRAELALQLESHDLVVETSFSFNASSVSGRIDELRPWMESSDAEAVAWIESIGADRFSLQVVSVGPGRAISRSIEVKSGEDAASELAIGTRTLLEEIYLESRTSIARPVPPTASPPTAVKKPVISVGLGFDVTVGLVGSEGPRLLFGGEMAGMVIFPNGVHLQICATGFGASDSQIQDDSFATGGVRPGFGVGWLHVVHRFSIGPTLLIEAPWQRAVVSDAQGPEITHDWWNLRFVPSLEMRLRVGRPVLLGLRTGPGISLFSPIFEREDGRVIYAAPILDWNARLSLIVDFN